MPRTDVRFFLDQRRCAPVLLWMDSAIRDDRARAKLIALIGRLEERGHELRRPEADLLDREVYELRVRFGKVNYRILYAFVGKNRAVLLHGCMKKAEVGLQDIETAVNRLAQFKRDPDKHTYVEDEG